MATHGKIGKVKVASAVVADIDNWSIDNDRDEKESTAFGDAALPFRSWVMGLIGSSGSFSGRLNMGDTNGQLAIWNSMTSDTPLTLHLQTDGTTPHEFAVSAFIKKFSAGTKVDDLESLSCDFRVTGAPTYS